MLEVKKCAALTKKSDPCKGKALPDSDYCFNPSHQALEKPLEETSPVEVPVAEAADVCGHINRHSKGIDGKLNYLSCDLEPEHEGFHSAIHYTRRLGMSYRDEDNQRKVIRDIEFEGEERVTWTDMAGTPVEDIQQDLASIRKDQPFMEKSIGLR